MTDLCTRLLNHCLGVGRLQVDADWSHAPHAHGFHQMMVVLGGSLAVDQDHETCIAKAGSYLPTPRAASTPSGWLAAWVPTSSYFAFDGPLLPQHELLARDRNGRGRQLASWMAADAATDADPDQLDRLAQALLGEWHQAVADPTPGFVHRVRAWAGERLDQPIRVGDLATVAAMGRHISVGNT